MSTEAAEVYALRGRAVPLERIDRGAALAQRFSAFADALGPPVVLAAARVAAPLANLGALDAGPMLRDEGQHSAATGAVATLAPATGVASRAETAGPAVEDGTQRAPTPAAHAFDASEGVRRAALDAASPNEQVPARRARASAEPAAESVRLAVAAVAAPPLPRADRGASRASTPWSPEPARGPAQDRSPAASAHTSRRGPELPFDDSASARRDSTALEEGPAVVVPEPAAPARDRLGDAPPPRARPVAEPVLMGAPEIPAPSGREIGAAPHGVVERLARAVERVREETLHIGSVQVIVRPPAAHAAPAPAVAAPNRGPSESSASPRPEFHSVWLTSKARYD